MIIVLFFVFVLLSYLPFLHSTTDDNTSTPTCPKSFSCWDYRKFEYPFYSGTDTRCGLIKVNCTKNGGEIQVGNQSYEIRNDVGSGSGFLVHNRTFEKLVKNESCKALMNNFTSPSPLLYSMWTIPFITLFKCRKNPNHTTQIDAYFDNYHSYNRCKDHNFYYKNSIITTEVPNDLPRRCEVIRLPVESPDGGNRPDYTNIFSILSFEFYISFPLSPCCDECRKKEGWCETHNGKFQCLDAKKDKWDKKLILISAGSAIILMLSFIVLIIWRCYKRNPFSYFSSKDKSQDLEDESVCFGIPVFSYKELEDATRNFEPSQELGDGGFGTVYYGKLKDGREVAVKRLYEHNYKRVQQFMNEVEILTRLRHKNLVLLYGCTSSRSRELLLVYEYIPNGTVADHLHGEQANPRLLTWPIRMKIAIETARALVYLHASEIIHRDVKTSNILLDHNFCVKVADFGLSRLLPNDVTHVSTAPQGTPGYVDPQYHRCFQLTDKSDVYSFGVVLIELISSMEAVDVNRSRDEISLANLAITKIQRNEIDELVDPLLGSDSDAEIRRMITSVAELAFLCLQFDSDLRPAMTEVLEILEDIRGEGRTEAQDSIGELKNLKPPPSPETEVALVLLKNLQQSPVSVTGKWHSDGSRSTLSISGDRLPMKNRISS